MKMTFRWYGEKDCIPLAYIKQIQGMSGVVTAVYDTPVGEVWVLSALERLKSLANAAGLEMEVIESVPVHEDIKLGKPSRVRYTEAYKQNIRNCAKVGVKCICYNFMPVFDWLRTDLKFVHPDGANSLAYDGAALAALDPDDLHLPGWDESYSKDELGALLAEYKGMTHEQLFENLVWFLREIMPVCDETGVNGFMILPILAVALNIVSQIIMRKQQKKSGQDAQLGQNKGCMTAMVVIMPLLMAYFAFIYCAAFTLYMVLNSVMSLLINLVTTGITRKMIPISASVTKEGGEFVEKYGRPDPNKTGGRK